METAGTASTPLALPSKEARLDGIKNKIRRRQEIIKIRKEKKKVRNYFTPFKKIH